MRARQPFNDSRDDKNITHFKLMNSASATLTARPTAKEDWANKPVVVGRVVVFVPRIRRQQSGISVTQDVFFA